MENFELQSCRSRQKLQFSYKFYLHLSSNKKIQIFEKRLDPYRRGPRRQEVLQYGVPPTAVGHGVRSLTPSHTAPDV
jgi:hypothetical protein